MKTKTEEQKQKNREEPSKNRRTEKRIKHRFFYPPFSSISFVHFVVVAFTAAGPI